MYTFFSVKSFLSKDLSKIPIIRVRVSEKLPLNHRCFNVLLFFSRDFAALSNV